ncbi:MAG: TatD family hydrolase [Acidimicrobiales bacterium]|jgi:TatD DNase family protein|nr:TatD family hydrolase [Acidimicrobiales bacterium]MDP6297966.1 TatD family hydrolase [Acidimicrobiales bacterium]HJM27923.1 TatD family hydrolase [Acidimicrobiales bacterium]HJM97933.1 TatD family hydrolase [Acidimicrobiales bacterium]
MKPETKELCWIDNHCHFSNEGSEKDVIQEGIKAGVQKFINIGTDLESSKQAVRLAELFPNTVFATAGIHPHDASKGIEGIHELLSKPEIVAVGECGLDFYYNHSPAEQQKEVFSSHIGYANEKDMPLVIHTRDAWEETFNILDSEGTPSRTVFHCFTGGPQEAEMALARGANLSFSGIITFKNAPEVREALKMTPIDRIMIETDSPYLAPVPKRGKKNYPAYLPYIAERVATEINMGIADLSKALWNNTNKFYSLPQETTPRT